MATGANIPKTGKSKLTVTGRIVLFALTAWALAMIAPDLQRVIDSMGSFGVSVDNNGTVTDVVAPFAKAADSPAAEAGLAVGDRIDLKAMRCVPPGTAECKGLVAVLGGFGGMQSAMLEREITLTVDPRERRAAEEGDAGVGAGSADVCGPGGAAGGHAGGRGGDRHRVLAGVDAPGLDDLGAVRVRDVDQSGAVVHVLRGAATLAGGGVRAGTGGSGGELARPMRA